MERGAGTGGGPCGGGRPARLARRVCVYLHVATVLNLRSIWSWTHEPVGFMCQHPPLPANNSGIRVLIYSPSKSGTTATQRVLAQLYSNAYHSEDMSTHVWAPLVDEHFRRPERGGGALPWERLATPQPPARKGHSFAPRDLSEDSADTVVLGSTGPELLAERISRCRVDTLAFDGINALFWPVYNVSPDAKVVMLNWRTYEEWKTSRTNFRARAVFTILASSYVSVGQHFLPWNAVVLPLWDRLTGNRLRRCLQDGTPLSSMTSRAGAISCLFLHSIAERRIIQHWSSGLNTGFGDSRLQESREDFDEFWSRGRRLIPEERRLEFDLKRDTVMDLCRFLGKEDAPVCKIGKVPKVKPNLLTQDDDRLVHFVLLLPYYFLIHYVNYRLFWGLMRCLCTRPSGEDRKSKLA